MYETATQLLQRIEDDVRQGNGAIPLVMRNPSGGAAIVTGVGSRTGSYIFMKTGITGIPRSELLGDIRRLVDDGNGDLLVTTAEQRLNAVGRYMLGSSA